MVAANERLRAIVAERPELEGMGTTLTAMLWSGGRFGMVHVGDSRAYRLREGLLEQMTADHTWVQRLIDEGRITEEEAGHHPQRSLLMRVLDGRTQVEADIGTFDAHPATATCCAPTACRASSPRRPWPRPWPPTRIRSRPWTR